MWNYIKSISLTKWIFFSMIVGTLIGFLFPEFSQNLRIISNIFLRLIKSIIVPILFGTLVVGIAGHNSDLRSLGKLAFRSILYFEIVTTIALFIGLGAVNLTKPGVGVVIPPSSTTQATGIAPQQFTLQGLLEHMVPKSFIEAAANNDVLQVVFFTILFAIALTQVPQKIKEPILNFCESLSEVMFKFTGLVMKFAPFGIGAAISYTVGHSGPGILMNLGSLVLTLYGSLAVLIIFVFIPILWLFKLPLRRFWEAVKEPAMIAFSTTSSDAALPKAMQRMVQFGVPKRIVSFVIPTGYSFNLDGSTMYLAIASIFVAQAAGLHFTIWQQLSIMLTLMITTKGIAAVPRASLVILSGTLLSFGMPLEGVAIIMGVDELMDMARTSTNLVGNCLASAVMARWDKSLDMSEPIPVD